MVSNLQTKVIMRVEDAESAKRLADILGQEEIDEVTKPLIYRSLKTKVTARIPRARAMSAIW